MENQEESDIQKSGLNRNRKYLGILIPYIIIFLVITTYLYATAFTSKDSAGELIFYLLFILTTFGIGGYGLSFILALIGLIISAIGYKKNKNSKGVLITYIILTFLPIIFFFTNILICKIQ